MIFSFIVHRYLYLSHYCNSNQRTIEQQQTVKPKIDSSLVGFLTEIRRETRRNNSMLCFVLYLMYLFTYLQSNKTLCNDI
jgi:hypothetical protein